MAQRVPLDLLPAVTQVTVLGKGFGTIDKRDHRPLKLHDALWKWWARPALQRNLDMQLAPLDLARGTRYWSDFLRYFTLLCAKPELILEL